MSDTEMLEALRASIDLVTMLPEPFNPIGHETGPADLLLAKVLTTIYDNPAEGCRAIASLLKCALEMGVIHYEKLIAEAPE
jgi:hypothetical protein